MEKSKHNNEGFELLESFLAKYDLKRGGFNAPKDAFYHGYCEYAGKEHALPQSRVDERLTSKGIGSSKLGGVQYYYLNRRLTEEMIWGRPPHDDPPEIEMWERLDSFLTLCGFKSGDIEVSKYEFLDKYYAYAEASGEIEYSLSREMTDDRLESKGILLVWHDFQPYYLLNKEFCEENNWGRPPFKPAESNSESADDSADHIKNTEDSAVTTDIPEFSHIKQVPDVAPALTTPIPTPAKNEEVIKRFLEQHKESWVARLKPKDKEQVMMRIELTFLKMKTEGLIKALADINSHPPIVDDYLD